MRGLSMLRVVLALLPALAMAACGGDARETTPPGYGPTMPPSGPTLPPENGPTMPGDVLPGAGGSGGTSSQSSANDDAGSGIAAQHRSSSETCSNDHPSDFCFDDSDCRTGGPCVCAGSEARNRWNVCLDGNCQTDADCGDDGRCSPTLSDCGDYGGIIGYYCHTPQDTCVNDSDCSESAGYCMYRPELGHWQCGYTQCVG